MDKKYITMSLDEYEELKEQCEKLKELLAKIIFDKEHPIDINIKTLIEEENYKFGWWW